MRSYSDDNYLMLTTESILRKHLLSDFIRIRQTNTYIFIEFIEFQLYHEHTQRKKEKINKKTNE